jgi:hypothetical protein
MGRWNGTTKERGYGSDHQAIRKQRIAAYRPGDICTMGGEPLWQPPELLDVPHDHVNGGYLPGLSCRKHNRGEGAIRNNQIRGFTLASAGPKGPYVICKACGQNYTRAARICEICGAHYHPSYAEQRTCSRACGVQLVRRNKMARGWVPPAQRPRRPRKQGPVQSGEREPKNGWPATAIAYYTCRYCGKVGVQRATAAPGYGAREVCPERECQLARLAANNLITRKGMTREQADRVVMAYRAEGDHRQLPASRRW